jgi:hypothetical protein
MAAKKAKAAAGQKRRYLRGDPDRPFPQDLDALNRLARETVFPTHEPVWFYRNRGTASPKEKDRALHYQTIENVERMCQLGLQMPKRAHFF